MSFEIKYEPKSINDVVFTNTVTEAKINAIFQGYRTRSLFLWGTNGNGKTLVADLIAKHLTEHNPHLFDNKTIEQVMALDDIYQYVHNTKTYAMCSGAQSNDRVVMVFHELDEYKGSLSKLWTDMDRLKDDLLVIITTNNPMQFQNAVRSRCEKLEFNNVTPENFVNRAQFILNAEGVNLSNSDVVHYLTTMTPKTRDVRDYLSVLEQIVFLSQINSLPLVPATQASTSPQPVTKPSLIVVK